MVTSREGRNPVPNTNRGVASWGDMVSDITIAAPNLDRLLHKPVVINIDGDSYRPLPRVWVNVSCQLVWVIVRGLGLGGLLEDR